MAQQDHISTSFQRWGVFGVIALLVLGAVCILPACSTQVTQEPAPTEASFPEPDKPAALLPGDMSGEKLEMDLRYGKDNQPVTASSSATGGLVILSPDMSGATLEMDLRHGKGNQLNTVNIPVTGGSTGFDFSESYWLVVGPAGQPPVDSGE